MTPTKAVVACIAVASACLSLAAPAFSSHSVKCSTRGLATAAHARSGVEILSLTASGVSCGKAVELARTITNELELGKPLSSAGSTEVGLSQTTPCGSCATDTHVSLTYANGATIELALKGHLRSAVGGTEVPFPQLPDIPVSPCRALRPRARTAVASRPFEA